MSGGRCKSPPSLFSRFCKNKAFFTLRIDRALFQTSQKQSVFHAPIDRALFQTSHRQSAFYTPHRRNAPYIFSVEEPRCNQIKRTRNFDTSSPFFRSLMGRFAAAAVSDFRLIRRRRAAFQKNYVIKNSVLSKSILNFFNSRDKPLQNAFLPEKIPEKFLPAPLDNLIFPCYNVKLRYNAITMGILCLFFG